jgi:hypothetical protein
LARFVQMNPLPVDGMQSYVEWVILASERTTLEVMGCGLCCVLIDERNVNNVLMWTGEPLFQIFDGLVEILCRLGRKVRFLGDF